MKALEKEAKLLDLKLIPCESHEHTWNVADYRVMFRHHVDGLIYEQVHEAIEVQTKGAMVCVVIDYWPPFHNVGEPVGFTATDSERKGLRPVT